jgi:S1-C subfamily serine protease
MAAMPPAPGPAAKLAVLTEAERKQFGISASINGVLVQSVANDIALSDQGLKPGDVIVEVDGTPVGTPDEVEGMIRTARAEHQIYVPFLVSGKNGLRWLSYYTGMKEAK